MRRSSRESQHPAFARCCTTKWTLRADSLKRVFLSFTWLAANWPSILTSSVAAAWRFSALLNVATLMCSLRVPPYQNAPNLHSPCALSAARYFHFRALAKSLMGTRLDARCDIGRSVFELPGHRQTRSKEFLL